MGERSGCVGWVIAWLRSRWQSKGRREANMSSFSEWYNKGVSLNNLGCNEEAIRCYDQTLELDPGRVNAWYNKAANEKALGRRRKAARAYRQFLALAPAQYAQQIENARQRVRELQGK